MGLLAGILPLLIFVIIDSFLGLNKALVSAVILAILEAGFSLYYFHEVDSVTLFSLLTVALFCFISYKKSNPLFLKMQPTLISSIIGIILIVSYLINDPLLLNMSLKYADFFPPQFQKQIHSPLMQQLLIKSTLTVGWAHIAHAIVCGLAAFKLNKWWWIAIRGIGYYFFMIAGLIAAKVF